LADSAVSEFDINQINFREIACQDGTWMELALDLLYRSLSVLAALKLQSMQPES